MSIAVIEDLWRAYLQIYGEPQVRAELPRRWGADANITQERVQFDFPPTFQPGYVGPAFFQADSGILFLGYNPGEGKLQSSQDEDKSLARELRAFAEGRTSLDELSKFQAGHLVRWPVYRAKGIFSETGDASISLLPAASRPSVQAVALLNLFPLKTVGNKKPLAGYGGNATSLKTHMWECLVKPTIEALAPKLVVRYPDSDSYASQLEQLESKPTVLRVWHPSDYNLSAQRSGLAASWSALANCLSAAE